MFDRNQLGCQQPRCSLGRASAFVIGEEIARSLGNGRSIRRASMDTAEIRRRAEIESRTGVRYLWE